MPAMTRMIRLIRRQVPQKTCRLKTSLPALGEKKCASLPIKPTFTPLKAPHPIEKHPRCLGRGSKSSKLTMSYLRKLCGNVGRRGLLRQWKLRRKQRKQLSIVEKNNSLAFIRLYNTHQCSWFPGKLVIIPVSNFEYLHSCPFRNYHVHACLSFVCRWVSSWR